MTKHIEAPEDIDKKPSEDDKQLFELAKRIRSQGITRSVNTMISRFPSMQRAIEGSVELLKKHSAQNLLLTSIYSVLAGLQEGKVFGESKRALLDLLKRLEEVSKQSIEFNRETVSFQRYLNGLGPKADEILKEDSIVKLLNKINSLNQLKSKKDNREYNDFIISLEKYIEAKQAITVALENQIATLEQKVEMLPSTAVKFLVEEKQNIANQQIADCTELLEVYANKDAQITTAVQEILFPQKKVEKAFDGGTNDDLVESGEGFLMSSENDPEIPFVLDEDAKLVTEIESNFTRLQAIETDILPELEGTSKGILNDILAEKDEEKRKEKLLLWRKNQEKYATVISEFMELSKLQDRYKIQLALKVN